MDIEELKWRQKEKYLQAGAIVPIDMLTTGDLVHELRQSAVAIESLQRELEAAKKEVDDLREILRSHSNSLEIRMSHGDHHVMQILTLEEINRSGDKLALISVIATEMHRDLQARHAACQQAKG